MESIMCGWLALMAGVSFFYWSALVRGTSLVVGTSWSSLLAVSSPLVSVLTSAMSCCLRSCALKTPLRFAPTFTFLQMRWWAAMRAEANRRPQSAQGTSTAAAAIITSFSPPHSESVAFFENALMLLLGGMLVRGDRRGDEIWGDVEEGIIKERWCASAAARSAGTTQYTPVGLTLRGRSSQLVTGRGGVRRGSIV